MTAPAAPRHRRGARAAALALLAALLSLTVVVASPGQAEALETLTRSPSVSASTAAAAGTTFDWKGIGIKYGERFVVSCGANPKRCVNPANLLMNGLGVSVELLYDYQERYAQDTWNRPDVYVNSHAVSATAASLETNCPVEYLAISGVYRTPGSTNNNYFSLDRYSSRLTTETIISSSDEPLKGLYRHNVDLAGLDGSGANQVTSVVYFLAQCQYGGVDLVRWYSDWPEGSRSAPAPTNSNAARVTRVSGTCVTGTGATVAATPQLSASYVPQASGEPPVAVPSLKCPAGSSPGDMKVEECVAADMSHCRTVLRTPDVTTTAAGTDPSDPCGPAGGYRCTLDVWKVVGSTMLQCGSQVACPATSYTPGAGGTSATDPSGAEYRCVRSKPDGWEVVPWERCEGLLEDAPTTDAPSPGAPPRPQPAPYPNPGATPTPYPSPSLPAPAPGEQPSPGVQPYPQPQPQPSPNPDPSTGPSTGPSPTTSPSTGPSPSPTTGPSTGTSTDPEFPLDPTKSEPPQGPSSITKCVPSGWKLLNPVSYVYGTACVLSWAFVPPDLPSVLVPLVNEVKSKPPGSLIIGGVSGFTQGLESYKVGCSQPLTFGPLTFPCTNPLGTTGVWLRNTAGVLIVLCTAIGLVRIASGTINDHMPDEQW